jgi:hypothetical protein
MPGLDTLRRTRVGSPPFASFDDIYCLSHALNGDWIDACLGGIFRDLLGRKFRCVGARVKRLEGALKSRLTVTWL